MHAVSRFERLNARQREAACFGAAPLLILAGAGTGKTATLAHRVAHLVLEGASPQRILLLTFTRRAAEEMTRRARRIVNEAMAQADARLAWSGTFHSIANRLIRRHAASVGLDERFSVLDRADAADLMDLARHELGLSKAERRFPRKDTCLAIYSHAVNTRTALPQTLERAFPWCAEWAEELAGLFRGYVERKLAAQALDYDDLLLYWHAMLGEARLAQEIGGAFDHILVDEYQDTNALQAEILERLRPGGEGLTVVGDDAQAIYSFRGATVENILAFGKRARAVVLEENYRSTQPILDAANVLIGKTLRATRSGGERPRYVTVADDQAQALYVVGRVLEAREAGVALKRQAVLFRSSHHSDVLELELARRNIPFVKYGGLKFLEAAHVKDLLSVLRWADNPKNRVAAFRALQLLPGVGPAKAEVGFKDPQTVEPDFRDLLHWLMDPATPWPGQLERVRAWYQPHLERLYDEAHVRAGDLEQLERVSSNYSSREEFLTELALDPPAASGDLAGAPWLDEDYLVLSTVHSAKGQEWDAVYVLNVADGSFPSEFATGRADSIEEERRLLYVALTRAKSALELVAPLKYYVTQQARLGDRHVYGAQSRFMTRAVLACFEHVCFADKPALDVGARLRAMW